MHIEEIVVGTKKPGQIHGASTAEYFMEQVVQLLVKDCKIVTVPQPDRLLCSSQHPCGFQDPLYQQMTLMDLMDFLH